jgi:hypothetical protein
MKTFILCIFLSIPILTNAQVTKEDWFLESAFSPLIVTKTTLDKRLELTPIKVLYTPNAKLLVGLTTNLFRQKIGVYQTDVVDISPDFQYVFLNQKKFSVFGEVSGGYSHFWNIRFPPISYDMNDPLISNKEVKQANGFNASIGLGGKVFIFNNIGIQTSIRYNRRQAHMIKDYNFISYDFDIKQNHILLNTVIFIRLHKNK